MAEFSYAWDMFTVALTDDYVSLEVVLQGKNAPVVPMNLDVDAETLILAAPAQVAPWLPYFMVALADPATREASEDGQQVMVVAPAVMGQGSVRQVAVRDVEGCRVLLKFTRNDDTVVELAVARSMTLYGPRVRAWIVE